PVVMELQVELRRSAFPLAFQARGLVAQLGADRSPTYHGRGFHGSSASCDSGGGPPEMCSCKFPCSERAAGLCWRKSMKLWPARSLAPSSRRTDGPGPPRGNDG